MADSSGVVQDLNIQLQQPEGLAFDWLGNNIYWTDSGKKMIEMARMDGHYRRTLIAGLTKPKAIVLDPYNGYVFMAECLVLFCGILIYFVTLRQKY